MIKTDNSLTHSGGTLIEKNLGYKVLNLEGDTCVDFPMTAAVLFRKNEMVELGLFDEDFFLYYPDIEIGRRVKSTNKSIIQIFRSRAFHSMGRLKINNPIKRVFFRNYFYTLDELIYYHKVDLHLKPMENLKNEIPNLFKKMFLNLFIFKFADVVVCFSKIFAYFQFKNKYLKKKIIEK